MGPHLMGPNFMGPHLMGPHLMGPNLSAASSANCSANLLHNHARDSIDQASVSHALLQHADTHVATIYMC